MAEREVTRGTLHITRRGAIAAGLVGAAGVFGLGVATDLVMNDAAGIKGLFGSSGLNVEGSFFSRFRRQRVGYTIGYPSGHQRGDALPLVVVLHGFRGNHHSAVSGYTPSQAATLTNGTKPSAVVTVDGGQGYWHPHPMDDPMSMVIEELIPLMNSKNLGVGKGQVAVMGTSMGGYGALIFAEHYPRSFAAVAAISPAIFETYSWAHYVNPGAYWSAGDFERYDAITHASALAGQPVRVASGDHDPFHPWVEAFQRELPAPGYVLYPPGAHEGGFFASQTGPALDFVSGHFQ